MRSIRGALTPFALFAAIVLPGCMAPPSPAAPPSVAAAVTPGEIKLRAVSTRAEFVSGGDVLIEAVTRGVTGGVSFTLNGDPVSPKMFGHGDTHLVMVTGLRAGPNRLTVTAGDGAAATLDLVNHSLAGPILSGPHLSPYECRTVESGLGEPLDANCSARTRIDYFYRSSADDDRGRPVFKPLADPSAARPADLAFTTTIEGRRVPYIVRVESGTINRTIYRLAVLDDPMAITTTAPDATWRPGEGWNGRLAVTFGGGSGTQYNQGQNDVTSILNDLYLSRGFAFLNATELVNQLHSNAVLQGETLMMLKEHVIETFGPPKWTVGTGGSGGAIQQLVITQMFPGLLDGLQPSLSYPDSTLNTADCGLFQKYWATEAGAKWSKEKRFAVEGLTPGTCAAWERSFVPVMSASNKRGCALKDESLIYDPVTNPKGARCTIADMRANIYGRDPATGFARKPQDNVGVQYGLAALKSGAITVEEFLNLNEGMGGNDIDGAFTGERSVGDPIAIKALYDSGLLNSGGGGLSNVPILSYRPYLDPLGDIHDRHRDFTIRARLERANGSAANHVIWVSPANSVRPGSPGPDVPALALDAMTRWLDGLAADPAPLSLDKVVLHKPADVVDGFWTGEGVWTASPASFSGDTPFNAAYPVHSEPRLIAGAPLTNDVMKCALKPVDFADYGVSFSARQKTRMMKIFAEGVCDYTRPGLHQGPIAGVYRAY
ncbi:hypothetical protein GC169_10925 [bacterium]|nr:hypothetical protein [bacterium]